MNDNYQKLSPRQREILKHLVLGLSVKEIARVTQRSLKSVDSHRYRILHTMQAGDSFRLCLRAIEAGAITVAELPVVSTQPPDLFLPLELQMLPLLAQGVSSREVSFQFQVTAKDVEGALHRIMSRLGISRRIQLLHYALQQKLIDVQICGAASPEIDTTCPDCRGSGRYVGLHAVEVCRLCQGHGTVSRAG